MHRFPLCIELAPATVHLRPSSHPAMAIPRLQAVASDPVASALTHYCRTLSESESSGSLSLRPRGGRRAGAGVASLPRRGSDDLVRSPAAENGPTQEIARRET